MKKSIRWIAVILLILAFFFIIVGFQSHASGSRLEALETKYEKKLQEKDKHIKELEAKLAEYGEDYMLYADLYNECEFNLDSTMKTLEETIKERDALKKN